MGSFKLLPALIFISFLAFSVRLASIVSGIEHISGVAMAEEKTPADQKSEEKKPEDKKPEDKKEATGKAEVEEKNSKAVEKKADEGDDWTNKPYAFDAKEAEAPEWKDAGDSDFEGGDVNAQLFEDISKRRQQLDKEEKDLQVKEALLKAATKELDRKYQELSNLRKEIEGLLEKQSEEETARISSLVKIYEGMKPADAARIFDTLDLDVLISVFSKMSEKKISPIMAAMNAERARTVTIMLAEQKKLPTLPAP